MRSTDPFFLNLQASQVDRNRELSTGEIRDSLRHLQRGFSNILSKVICKATETISIGQAVNIYASGAEAWARLANATDSTKPCHGVAISVYGDEVEILLAGGFYKAEAFSVASRYFLSTTGGALTTTAPAASGNIVQPIGFSLDANNFFVNPTLLWSTVP